MSYPAFLKATHLLVTMEIFENSLTGSRLRRFNESFTPEQRKLIKHYVQKVRTWYLRGGQPDELVVAPTTVMLLEKVPAAVL